MGALVPWLIPPDQRSRQLPHDAPLLLGDPDGLLLLGAGVAGASVAGADVEGACVHGCTDAGVGVGAEVSCAEVGMGEEEEGPLLPAEPQPVQPGAAPTRRPLPHRSARCWPRWWGADVAGAAEAGAAEGAGVAEGRLVGTGV